MNCERVKRRLNACRAGQLPAWRTRRILAHLQHCSDCRREQTALDRLDAVLGHWSVAAEPRPGFETRVWNRIRAAEKRPAAWHWWQRPGWVLGTACAAALFMVALTGGVARERAEAAAQRQLYASIGLNQLDVFPAGSLTANYLKLP